MATAVLIRNPHTGNHYQRSIWYRAARRNDAIAARDDWLKSCPDCAAILVESDSQTGE